LPSGWNVYYIVVLAGGLALLIPLALVALSRALSPKPTTASHPAPAAPLVKSDNPAEIGRKSNPRFFLALNAASILILLALLMIPCAVSLPGAAALVLILSFCALAGLGLLYGVRKHDLDWLKTFRETGRETGGRE
jgi:NADH:ubiquinone oxidoreductase subunit 3 (subunit A)